VPSVVRSSPEQHAVARLPSRRIVLAGHAYEGTIVAGGSGSVIAGP
jgi:TctA family transporter